MELRDRDTEIQQITGFSTVGGHSTHVLHILLYTCLCDDPFALGTVAHMSLNSNMNEVEFSTRQI